MQDWLTFLNGPHYLRLSLLFLDTEDAELQRNPFLFFPLGYAYVLLL